MKELLEGAKFKSLTIDEIEKTIDLINDQQQTLILDHSGLESIKSYYSDLLVKSQKIEQTEEKLPYMMSLFEFLGRAAGGELGAEVYKTARALKETINSSKIVNPKYEGNVMTYRREFLDEYFKTKIYEGEKK